MASCALLALALGGCSLNTPAPPSQPSTSTSGATGSGSPSGSTTSVAGTSSGTGKTAAPTFNSWFTEVMRRVQEYDKKRPVTSQTALLSPDADAVARRHPAWLLADALQRAAGRRLLAASAGAGVPPVLYNAPRIGGPGQSTFNGNTTGGGSNAGLGGAMGFGVGNGYSGGASRDVTILASGLPELQRQMRLRQERSLDAFLTQAAGTQSTVRAQDRLALLAAMREDIDLARQVNLDALDPLLPSDAVQLEMTNLNLDIELLQQQVNDRTSLTSPAQIEQARTRLATQQRRLAELETAWRRSLREQELERRDLLARLREERPRQIEEQRNREILAQLQGANQEDQQERATARVEQRQRIAEDFEAADARMGIVIPGAGAVNRRLAGNFPAGSGNASSGSTFRTAGGGLTSFPALETTLDGMGAVTEGERQALAGALAARLTPAELSAQIRRLRQQARTDARQWSRIVQRRNRALQRVAQPAKPTGSAPAKSPAKSTVQ